jgi:hypothetical protein
VVPNWEAAGVEERPEVEGDNRRDQYPDHDQGEEGDAKAARILGMSCLGYYV